MLTYKTIIMAATLMVSAMAAQAGDTADRGLSANQRTIGYTSTDSIT